MSIHLSKIGNFTCVVCIRYFKRKNIITNYIRLKNPFLHLQIFIDTTQRSQFKYLASKMLQLDYITIMTLPRL